MKKVLSVCLTLALLLALAVPAFAGGTAEAKITGTFCYTAARSELELVNAFRTGAEAWYWNADDTTKTQYAPGELGELRIDPALEQIAMERARELALSFSHTRPNGERCFTLTAEGNRSYGENIAYGYPTAESVVTAWREDADPYAGQGHRRNMLGSGYVAVGFGCFLYRGVYYWAQEFSYSDSGAALTDRADEEVTGAVVYSTDAFGENYWSDEGNCPAAYYTPPEPTPEPTPELTPAPEVLFGSIGLVLDGETHACDVYRVDGAHCVTLRALGGILGFEVGYAPATDMALVDAAAGQYAGCELGVVCAWAMPEVTCVPSAQKLSVGGAALGGVTAYSIDGTTYFSLESLAEVLGFTVALISEADYFSGQTTADPDPEPQPEPQPDFEIGSDGTLKKYLGAGGVVVIPETVTKIGEGAFDGCEALTGVVIGENVTYIGKRAFRGCTGLTALELPESVTGVGTAAFSECTGLTALSGCGGAAFLGDRSFAGCAALETVTIAAGKAEQHIGDNAFSGCAALKTLTVPVTVVSVGENAFLGCDALADVIYGGNETQWAAVKVDPTGNDALAAAALTFTGAPEPIVFADVAETDYFHTAVQWAVEVGVTNGTGEDPETGESLFSPAATVKRCEAVTFLWRSRGKPEPETTKNPFADVKETDYFYKAVLWAVENGITNGRSDDSFAPYEPVKRGEMLTFLWRTMDKPIQTEDYEGKQWFSDPEFWAHEVGCLGYIEASYTTHAACPRSDVVYYLFNAIILSAAPEGAAE